MIRPFRGRHTASSQATQRGKPAAQLCERYYPDSASRRMHHVNPKEGHSSETRLRLGASHSQEAGVAVLGVCASPSSREAGDRGWLAVQLGPC